MALTFDRSLVLRVASALLLMPIVLAALILGGWFFTAMLVVAIVVSVREWLRMSKRAPSPVINAIAGIGYIIFCFACFYYLRLYETNGAGLALALILSVWASDSVAYFTGKAIGGPKLAPSISPNKTWAGLIGGAVGSTLLLVLYALYIGPWLSGFGIDLHVPALSHLQWTVLGVLVTLAGQAGDLLESSEKRMAGVKDSGNLIPGHGGLLDRIDALLLASVAYVIALKAFGL